MTMIYVLVGLAAVVLLAVGVMFANRISPLSFKLHKPVFQVDGVALDGYDVTSYFAGEPKKGDPAHATDYQGVTLYFMSADSRRDFLADPERFLPQFGGYCAKAVSTGFAAPADPQVFAVVEDKLYIFSSEEVKGKFLMAPESMAAACEAKWIPQRLNSN